MGSILPLSLQPLNWAQLETLLEPSTEVELAPEALHQTQLGRQWLNTALQRSELPVYGVNTGFGKLCDVAISPAEQQELQRNLLLSHACGTGDPVPQPLVRLMLVLKAHALVKGHSGVRPELVQRLVQLHQLNITPVVYEIGSLGASGDLAPLAHLSLPIIGEGEVYWQGQVVPSAQALAAHQLAPLTLATKEGLALLNGTQFMGVYGVAFVVEANQLLRWALAISALSMEAFGCRPEPFHPLLQDIRPHPGQIEIAQGIRAWRAGSPSAATPRAGVQDPYSFRCVPQVHGAVQDALRHTAEVVLREVNSVTDNPNVFPQEGGLVLSGGNFHGQAIALALDYATLALAQLGGISERRIFQLQSGTRGLPPFLTPNPGLHSGLMILQYTAAALQNRLKHLALPVSHDSLPSCDGQEDFVSMGANAATKAWASLALLRQILAVELLHASQACHLLNDPVAPPLKPFLQQVRQVAPPTGPDRWQHPDVQRLITWLANTPAPQLPA
jgi:histidine ammonia-lyase